MQYRLALTPRVPQARTRVGPAPAFAVHAPVALGGGFFRRAAVVLDFGAAFFGLGRAGGLRVLRGLFARRVGFGGSAEDAHSDAGAQQRSQQGAAGGAGGEGSGVRHSRGARAKGAKSCHACCCFSERTNPSPKPPTL